MIIAAAQDTGGIAITDTWYEQAGATYAALTDVNHSISSLYGLVNVPSAVWIDEDGQVLRIDEGTYATKHKMGDFEFGRDDYAPMVADWVKNGSASQYVDGPVRVAAPASEQALAEPTFKLGVYFHQQGNEAKANQYWERAQSLNPKSWNYARQDWSFTPEQASANWAEKFEGLEGDPYYKPIEGLDGGD